MGKNDTTTQEPAPQTAPIASDSTSAELEAALMKSGSEALREVLHGLQTIRHGSIALTLHDGCLVEITKTMKIRPRLPDDKV
jgi:hypothetical protein